MDSSIHPIVRGDFIYRDVFLVDVGGDGKRHPRAAESEIKAILAGKSKDPFCHWWEAQLIHYGLNRSKVKDTCKVRLQQAIGQNKLKTQPLHLSEMEAEMRKEYTAAVRKAKSRANAGESFGQGRKRAREDEFRSSSPKRTKVSVKVNGIEIEIDQESSSSNKPNPSQGTEANMPAYSKAAPSKKSARAKASMEKFTDANPTKSTSTSKPDHASKKTNDSRQTFARRTSGLKVHQPENVFQTRPATTKVYKTPTKREPKVKLESSTGNRRFSSAVKNGSEQSYQQASPMEREGYLFDPDAMDTRADMSHHQVSVTGVYHLQCAQITEQLPDVADKLRLFVCVDHETGITWAAYELAMKSGVIKIDDMGVERKLSFGWRARDSETGGLLFGKGCFGDIAFYGDNQVRGCFYNLFPVLGMTGVSAPAQFEGMRGPGPLWCGRSAPSLKEEWDGFVQEAYGR